VFDYFGRKITIIIGMFSMAFLLAILPHYQSYVLFTLNKCAFNVVFNFVFVNPLIVDYIKPCSQARALAMLMLFGTALGEFLSMSVLNFLTKSWSH
jgi:MFS family permease